MSSSVVKTCRISDDNPADADLIVRVGIALAMHQRLEWNEIYVKVRNSVVTLLGEVPTDHDRRLVVAVVQHVAGVLSVNDELTVGDSSEATYKATVENIPSPSVNEAAEVHGEWTRGPFHHLPMLSDSLDDILARCAVSTAATI